MATSFSHLPIVDLATLSGAQPSTASIEILSQELHDVFATTGFAYLINPPLTFSHEDVFSIARDFFITEQADKMKLAKQSFVKGNPNTYRGYFPPQPGQMDNLKEGFEIGPSSIHRQSPYEQIQRFRLAEPNVWPEESSFLRGRERLEKLHFELQNLSSTLLSLLAMSLGKPLDYFSPYLTDSLSTLRLLHYPPQSEQNQLGETKLCCTPHTDSGILTLLHQDPTGGLEVLNASGVWVPAPYIPGSLVVNIGDLLAKVSGDRFVATMHRVRASDSGINKGDGLGRISVPFFFEPGENCVVRNIDDTGEGVVYGQHVRKKMATWVEFQDPPEDTMASNIPYSVAVEA